MKKRYALFAYAYYYPEGGFDDFIGTFNKKEEAKDAFKEKRFDGGQIVDLESLEVVEELNRYK